MGHLKLPSTIPPNYNGLIFSQSDYNKAVPMAFGRCKVSPIAIFAGNWQAQSAGGLSGSGGPTSGSGGGAQTYSANFDYLIGYGPIQGVLSIIAQGNDYYVNYFSQSFTQTGPAASFTFTISNQPGGHPVKYIIGVQVQQNFSVSYNDYGAPGPVTASGTWFLPLYNQLFPLPNQGDVANAGIPYAQYNAGSLPYTTPTVTVVFPTSQASCTVTIFYGYRAGAANVPTPLIGTIFERMLGSNTAAYSFTGAPTQIIYPEFSGFAGSNVQLSGPNNLGQYQFEAIGFYAMGFLPTGFAYQSGLCCPADVIADIVCSGGYQNSATRAWNHGLNFTSFPDTNSWNFSRYGGILADEPNLWAGGGTNQGLNSVRNYCMANGIFIAGVMDSQQNAAAWLQDLCDIANCAAAYDGAQLSFIPYSEVSAYGNGASYVASSAAGPVANFTDADFVVQKNDPPVVVQRTRTDDNWNQLTIEFLDQTVAMGELAVGWRPNSVTLVDELDMIQNGPMPGQTRSLHWIVDPTTATLVGNAMLKRHLIVNRRVFKFTVNASWGPLLTLMDLVTITDAAISPFPVSVRLTSITENEDWTLSIEAELFAYGASAPKITATQQTTTTTPPVNADPGSVSPPIIFEAIPAMSVPFGINQPEIWIAVGSNIPNYGGCLVWLSLDGGNTYNSVGKITGSQTTGESYSADYPLHANPDSVNTLNVDLTESDGELTDFSGSFLAQTLLIPLCIIEPGGTVTVNGQTLTIPYELISYDTANLSAANKYALPPSILRGVYGTPIVDHPIGSQFAFLGQNPSGKATVSNISPFRLPMNSTWIGTTLYFKFTAFNSSGLNQQQLSDATAYTFTPSGLVGWNIPGTPSSQPPPTIPVPTGSTVNPANDLYCPAQPGLYTTSLELMRVTPTRNVVIPAGFSASVAGCEVAPTSNVQVSITKNGTIVGTANITAGTTTATFTLSSAININGTGDYISWIAPSTADPTFAGFFMTIWAQRNN